MIQRIERGPVDAGKAAVDTPFALPAPRSEQATDDEARFDPFLVGGDVAPALHELVADGYGSQPSVRDFGLALIASLLHRQADDQGQTDDQDQAHDQGMVLWCQRQRDALEFGNLYGPGLRDLGFPPDRLLTVTGRRDADCLWAMEQGLASRSLLAVVGMVERVDLIASRRLSLAASAHDTRCLLLPLQHGRDPSAARKRWRIEAASSTPDRLDPKGLGRPCWRLALERSPSGRTGQWIVEWDHAAHRFHLAAPMADRPMPRRHGPDKRASSVIRFDRTG